MSANYWTSSQCNSWTIPSIELAEIQKAVLSRISHKELVKLNIYFSSIVHKLARAIAHALRTPIRAQVISTTIVYFKRFYTKNKLYEACPMLIIATCFYLASKTEESPVHIKTVVNEMKNLFSTNFPFDSSHISEFEFYLLEAMQFYTIVYHPYNTLTALINALDLDKKQSMIVLQTSSFIVNDCFRTDLCLTQPPHVVAIAALYVSTVLDRDNVDEVKMKSFLMDLNVDFLVVVECAQVLFNLYSVWSDYVDTQIPDILAALEEQ